MTNNLIGRSIGITHEPSRNGRVAINFGPLEGAVRNDCLSRANNGHLWIIVSNGGVDRLV